MPSFAHLGELLLARFGVFEKLVGAFSMDEDVALQGAQAPAIVQPREQLPPWLTPLLGIPLFSDAGLLGSPRPRGGRDVVPETPHHELGAACRERDGCKQCGE